MILQRHFSVASFQPTDLVSPGGSHINGIELSDSRNNQCLAFGKHCTAKSFWNS